MTNTHDPDIVDTEGEAAPERFVIVHDDYHARFVGTTADGNQFFITTPFSSTGEFAARYLFDEDGALLDATIVPLGSRPDDGVPPGNVTQFSDQSSALTELLEQLQPVTFGDIEIAPFSVSAHGLEFGMILHGQDPDYPEDDSWVWSITVEPGDYMCFYSPWDSGEYDT